MTQHTKPTAPTQEEINAAMASMERICNKHHDEDWYTVYDPYKNNIFVDYEMREYQGYVFLAHGCTTDNQYNCEMLASPIHLSA